MDEIANLDVERAERRGYPEAVYCQHKTVEQVAEIARRLRAHDAVALFTRIDHEQAAAVLTELPGAVHDRLARVVVWPPEPPPAVGEPVLIACAGTSDLPVAREAEITARYLGRATSMLVDIGIAGVHRALGQIDTLRAAGVIVVVAGMDGALPGLIAGLVSAPVIAVPTSVGYGAAFGGLAPLLSMLNACAPGVAVVNIDNGYGAGHMAAQIAAPRSAVSGDTSA